MADAKATMILLSRTDLTKDEVSALPNAEAWRMIYSLRTEKAKDDRLQICFTGFGVTEKKELTKVANVNNFKVVASVTKKLDYLCGGENAGPVKISRAEAQGVQFLDAQQFLTLVETGEV